MVLAAADALDASLAAGDAAPAVEWLRENLQRHGSLYRPVDLIERATGAPVSAEPLLDYLDAKFGEIYAL